MNKPLSKDLREQIVNNVIIATFAERENALNIGSELFAEKAYSRLIPADFAAAVKRLPKKYFSCHNQFRIARTIEAEDGNSQEENLVFPPRLINYIDHVNVECFPAIGCKPFPSYLVDRLGSPTFMLDGHQKAENILDEYSDLKKKADQISGEKLYHEAKLKSFLGEFRTVKQLIEACPELKSFVPAYGLCELDQQANPVVGSLITDLMRSGLKLSTVEA